MSIIIRGGQTTIHYTRMLEQITMTLLKIGISATLMFASYSFYRSPVTLYDLKTYVIFYYSKIATTFNEQAIIKVTNSYGQKDAYLAVDILNNSQTSNLVNYINQTAYNSTLEGVKYGVLAAGIVLTTFIIRGIIITQKKILRGQEILPISKLKLRIVKYNFVKHLMNVENHFRFIDRMISITHQSIILLLKTIYNFPILLSKFLFFILQNITKVIAMICPDFALKLTNRIKKSIKKRVRISKVNIFLFKKKTKRRFKEFNQAPYYKKPIKTLSFIIKFICTILLLNSKPAIKLAKFLKRLLIFKEFDIDKNISSILSSIKRIISLYSSIKLANIPYPKNSSHTHTLITGGSGTGKTVLMNSLIQQIRDKNQKAIIYDKMGVFTKYFYNPETDIILNPLDERSHNWDLTQECKTRPHCDNIASAFIPTRSTNSDPFWDNASKILLSEVIYHSQNLEDLLNTLFYSEESLEKIANSSMALKKIMSKNSGKTVASILVVFYTYIRSLNLLHNILNESFSIRDWISDDSKKGFLIVSSKADSQETLKPLLTAIFETAINSILSLKQDPSRNLWFFLDELPSLQYIPSLQSALAESRQFGASFIVSLQVMSQLKDIYGIQKAESVSGLCRNRVIFSTPDDDTARWCSNSLGKTEVEEVRESFTYGSHDMRDGVNLNKQVSIKNIVLPTEIMDLENLNCYIKFGAGFGVAKTKLDIVRYEPKAESFIEYEFVEKKLQETKPEELEFKIEENNFEDSKESEEDSDEDSIIILDDDDDFEEDLNDDSKERIEAF